MGRNARPSQQGMEKDVVEFAEMLQNPLPFQKLSDWTPFNSHGT